MLLFQPSPNVSVIVILKVIMPGGSTGVGVGEGEGFGEGLGDELGEGDGEGEGEGDGEGAGTLVKLTSITSTHDFNLQSPVLLK